MNEIRRTTTELYTRAWTKYKQYLGRKVKVSFNNNSKTCVIAEGVLLGFGNGGEFEVLDSQGFVHYCWPMLEVQEA